MGLFARLIVAVLGVMSIASLIPLAAFAASVTALGAGASNSSGRNVACGRVPEATAFETGAHLGVLLRVAGRADQLPHGDAAVGVG